MREIIFRGKAINREEGREYRTSYKNGDWVYGLVTKLYDERFELLPATMTNEYGISGIEIDHNTIGQYTGLKDCNGKRIYEGDIVRAEHNITKTWGEGSVEDGTLVVREEIVDSFSVEGDVCFEDGSFMLEGYYIGIFMPLEIEIIGNIHDNPELLKGVKK